MTGGGETEREESPDGEGDREVSPAVTCFQSSFQKDSRESSNGYKVQVVQLVQVVQVVQLVQLRIVMNKRQHAYRDQTRHWLDLTQSGLKTGADSEGWRTTLAHLFSPHLDLKRRKRSDKKRRVNDQLRIRLTEKGLPSESGPVSKARRLDWRPLCKEKGIPGLMVTETSLASNLNDCMWRMGMESGDERESQSLQMEDVAVPDRVLKIKISTTCEHPFQQQLFPEGVHETLLDRPPITKH
ncbi:hypothetical protein C8J56DRAFT_890311 [Mycena floridula]|nr:hypothetical protein C8J56DRAFT_890311 [Mycena floridula]